jgi:hypothetical protein
MRKRLEQREDEDLAPDGVRIEPTLDPAGTYSTKPQDIRPISVEEYTKQIKAAKASNESQKNIQIQSDDKSDQYDDLPERPAWKKVFSSVAVIALVSVNLALVYFEIQPKTLKPTLDVATPWGVAEISTPWGADEPRRIALLGAASPPTMEKENSAENTIIEHQ